MKLAKKLSSLLLALLIVLSLAAPAFAVDGDTTDPAAPAAEETIPTWDVTITGPENITLTDRTFHAYKLLDLKVIKGLDIDNNPSVGDPLNGATDAAPNDKVNDYVYTIPTEWLDFYKDYFKDDIPADVDDFDAQVRNRLAVMQSLGGDAYAAEPADWPDAASTLYDFALAARKWAHDNEIQPVKVTGKVNAVKFGKLPQGYYLIDDATHGDSDIDGAEGAVLSAVMLRSVDQNLNVNIKASVTSVEKEIVNSRNNDVNYTNGAIGDCVQFKLESQVPDTHGFTNYTFRFNDTLSPGLTYYSETTDAALIAKNDSHNDSYIETAHKHEMVVKVGDLVLTAVDDTYVPAEDTTDATRYNVYTLKIDGQKLYVQLPYILEATQNEYWAEGAPVVVTYYAWINENAVVVQDTNPNVVDLTYSNNPNDYVEVQDPEDPTKTITRHPEGTTPEDKVWVLTGKVTVKKIDNAGNVLTGAGFELTGNDTTRAWVTENTYEASENGVWYKLTDDTYTRTAPTTEGMDTTKYVVNDDGTYTKYKLVQTTKVIKGLDQEEVNLEGMVDENGLLTFVGLSEGTYTLTETVVPKGYNALDPITFTLTLERTPAVAGEYSDNDQYDYVLTIGSGETEQKVDTKNNNDLVVTVVNQAGQRLPSTGGMGTTVFYVVGGALVLAAVVLLITKKRMNG